VENYNNPKKKERGMYIYMCVRVIQLKKKKRGHNLSLPTAPFSSHKSTTPPYHYHSRSHYSHHNLYHSDNACSHPHHHQKTGPHVSTVPRLLQCPDLYGKTKYYVRADAKH
jgi:hypothetical protein